MVKISVIIPIYNVEHFLSQALDSVLNQFFDSMQILLVDDGSIDKSGKIADEYAERYTNVQVFHTENSGYAEACNLGLSKANGEYVSIIEPDDFVDRNMFAELYERAKKTNADIVKSRYFEFLDTPKFKDERACGAQITDTGVFTLKDHPELLSFHPSIWTCIYKLSFLKGHGIKFQTSRFRAWEDNLFQLKTLYLANRISYVNKAYYHWRVLLLFQLEKIKDVRMPLSVIAETHEWLDSVNCKSLSIFVNLFKREMVYYKYVFRKAKFSDIGLLSDSVSRYFNNLSKSGFEPGVAFKIPSKIKLLRSNVFLFFFREKLSYRVSKLFKFVRYACIKKI